MLAFDKVCCNLRTTFGIFNAEVDILAHELGACRHGGVPSR
jgi:hypothetical protein